MMPEEMKTWFILSAVLNLIFIPLLFFKSALNEIVLDIYKSWKHKKKERRENLLKLRSLLWDYSSIVSLIVPFGYIYFKARTVEDLESIEPKYKECQKAFEQNGKELSELKFHLPRGLKYRLDNILKEATNSVVIAIDPEGKILKDVKPMKFGELLEYSSRVSESCRNFAKEIEAEIR